MKLRFSVTAILSSALAAGAFAQQLAPVEGTRFFQTYITLSEAYDVSVADLYADDARIRSVRRYPTGQDRAMEVDGTKWKSLLRAAMPLAKAKGDRSEFRNIRAESAGDMVRIRADRYAVLKCYWDRQYFMLIGRRPDGRMQIVEEYMETRPESNC